LDLDFSPDGRYIVTVSSDDTIRVWESATGREVSRIIDEASSVAFSSDGKRLFTFGRGTAALWGWLPADLIAEACSRLSRNFTLEEWRQYIPTESYRKTCPNLP
jgi:WD40 repeat protein